MFQLFAVLDGLNHSTKLQGEYLYLLALIVTYIPFIGSLIGVYGATEVWGWNWILACLLFFWYVPIILFKLIMDFFSRIFSRMKEFFKSFRGEKESAAKK
jgi:hypothetical protein